MLHLSFTTLLMFVGVYSHIFSSGLKRDVSTDLATVMHHVNQMDAILHSTLTELQTTKVDVEATKTELQTTKSRLQEQQNLYSSMNRTLITTATELEVTKEDLQATKRELQKQKQHFSSMNSSLTADIQALQTELALKTKPIAFSVYLKSYIQTGSRLPVKFDGVLYNAGNGYNATTGMFTAPVTGTYIFSTQVEMSGNPVDTFIAILQSGFTVSQSWGQLIKDYHDITIPVTAIARVRQGEQVCVTSTHDVSLLAGLRSSHFVGSLLSLD